MNPLSAAAKGIGLSAFCLGLGWTLGVQALQPPPDADRHWAFQPVRAVEVPAVKNAAWAKTEVDRFILARLEAARLSPSPAADPRTLIRRISFDLTGLPPTYDEVERFTAAAKRNRQLVGRGPLFGYEGLRVRPRGASVRAWARLP
jgi:hypothetical protein